ncbi:MAG: restriction endonuclease subunit S [Fusobacterium gastrosuis]|uniref:restriction endonuclease subunit S n=1 Tax=Fusobacterium gastrosuis TaxID=1755100 RepID=UPI002A927E87|nr:restriction endonuclease subunit S [Fusobacterium gastrosuis]
MVKTNAWEQCKLGEIGNCTGGVSLESEFNSEGKYKVISIGSYSENSTYIDQNIRVNFTEKTKNKILNQDDLVMILNDKTSSGNIIGKVLKIEESDKYVFNQRTQRIEPKKIYNSLFLFTLFNAPNIREKIIKQSQGNTQIYVNWSTVKEIEYTIPSLKEQEKIGNFFKAFDDLITIHQRINIITNVIFLIIDFWNL